MILKRKWAPQTKVEIVKRDGLVLTAKETSEISFISLFMKVFVIIKWLILFWCCRVRKMPCEIWYSEQLSEAVKAGVVFFFITRLKETEWCVQSLAASDRAKTQIRSWAKLQANLAASLVGLSSFIQIEGSCSSVKSGSSQEGVLILCPLSPLCLYILQRDAS